MHNLFSKLKKLNAYARKCFLSYLWGIPFNQIGKNVNLELEGAIDVGEGLRIGRNATVSVEKEAKIRFGSNVYIGEGCIIKCYGGELVIGDNVSINAHTFINASGGVYIGNDTRIATKCVLIASNHIFSDPNLPIRLQGVTREGIKIGSNVWLGANVKVLDGVSIANNSVIAAGAVVNKTLEKEGLYAGIPAKFKKIISK